VSTVSLEHTTVPPGRGASFAVATAQTASRTLRQFLRTPQLVVVSTATGILGLLIFRYVFGGAVAHLGGVSYVDFVVPGFVTTGVLFTGMGAASGVAEDVQSGFVDRLRSLPIARSSLVAGRMVADAGLLAWGLVVTTAAGFAVGFRLHGSVAGGAAALGLCLLYGLAFDALFVTSGLYAGSAQAAQGTSFLVFPLSFVSSAYVPVSTMPSWMQPVARWQPMTAMVDSVRILADGPATARTLGHPLHEYLLLSLAWCAVLLVVFVPLAAARFRSS